jgi:excisionase family DNA binding protein
MTTLPNKDLFRVDEVATYFDVSRSTVYLWIDHGILIAEKYGGTIRIPRESVENCRFTNKLDPLK